ncbi:leucine-rich repeat-containing protein 15-like [Chironomus tepperi]|uniref:leucine-rich repeat-containing protein 15-like n=1 Tax=Chironomus tepperi TaxID=113505 RepID=UPI00391F183B
MKHITILVFIISYISASVLLRKVHDKQLYALEEPAIDPKADYVQASINNTTSLSTIECIFDITSTGYRCNAIINNPTGTDITSISGQHLPGRTDSDVQIVSILSQNTRNFPGIFCRQFGNVREISIIQSNLELVESSAFADCRSIEQIIINENLVTSLPANLFANSPRLYHVSFLFNQISQIHANAFVGTAIEFLDFGNNLLTAVNPQWFVPISSTLRSLDFFNNFISQVPDGIFSTLARLEFLMIGMNGVQLGNNPFLGLTSLRTLGLGRNGIRELNPSWFSPISQLQELFLCGNALTQLRPGDLDSLRNLITVRFNGNSLSTVSLDALGPSIATIRNLQVQQNGLTSFDPRIIENTPNLQILMLQGNVCVDQDFLDVGNQRDLVREALGVCHGNF